MERRGRRISSSSSYSSDNDGSILDPESLATQRWNDEEDSETEWLPQRRLRSAVGGRSSSTDDESGSEGRDYDSTNAIAFGVEEDDDDDDEVDDESDVDVHRSPPATITWPPAVADNSNRPEAIGNAKKKKPGIIYLSSIPTGFNVSRTTGFFSQYGRVGRVYLQPDAREKANRKDKLARNFTEGWIEFMSKKLAKEVASNLNVTQVGGKKRSKAHDVSWNIKYLPGFKWTHLSEKLAYEKAVHQQRMRTEISQAKRETDFFKSNLEKSKRVDKRKSTESGSKSPAKRRMHEFRQKEPDDVIRNKKKSKSAAPAEEPDECNKKRRLSGSGGPPEKHRRSSTSSSSNKSPSKKAPVKKPIIKAKKGKTKAAKNSSDKNKVKAKPSSRKQPRSDRSELLKSLM